MITSAILGWMAFAIVLLFLMAIIDCLNEHTQKQRFGDRIAQTIVERNIMKSHSAIGVSRVQVQSRTEFFIAGLGYG